MTIKNYQKNLDKDITNFISELQKKFPDVVITAGFRENAVTKFGKKSRHSTAEAVDIRINPEISDWLYNTKEGITTLNKYGLGMLDESKKENQKFGNAIHAGKDTALVERARNRYKELFGYDYGQEPVQKQEEILYELPSKSTTIVNNLPKSEESVNFAEQINKLEQDNLKKQAELEKAYEQVNNSFQYKQPNQEEQVVYEEQTPNVNYEDIFNQVSQFVDTPIAQQGLKQLPKFDINKYLKDKEIKNLKEVPKEVIRESTQTSFINEKGKQVNTNPNPKVNYKLSKEAYDDFSKRQNIGYGIAIAAPIAAPYIAGGLTTIGTAAAPYVETAMATQLPGMSSIPGATVGNAINAGFAGHGLYNIAPDAAEMYNNPSWSNAGNVGMDVLEIAPVVGPTGRIIGEGISTAGKYLTTKTPLQNAYKYNPWAFKPNPEAYYRTLGKEGIDDAFNSGVIRPKQSHSKYSPEVGKRINVNTPEFPEGSYFNKSGIYSNNKLYNPEYITEVVGKDELFTYPERIVFNENIRVAPKDIPIEQANFYKKDWLQGYKPVKVPESRTYNKFSNSNFKSEINWGNWNKEIPDNPQLMQEYNAIEQTSKANGTWMKNPDGSPFQGTPEQFVQQNSENFKKAFPNGINKVYRGVGPANNNPDFSKGFIQGDKAIFTADKNLAQSYAWGKQKENILTPFSSSTDSGIYELGFPKGDQINYNTMLSDWTDINLAKGSNKLNLEMNLEQQKKALERYLKNYEGSVDDDLISHTKNRIKQLEQYIQDFDNIPTNHEELRKMRSILGDTPSTDDIAAYLPKTNLNNITLQNVIDGGLGDVTIVNNRVGNYLKSLRGNNGMFDMTNPNIYKSILPVTLGIGAASQLEEKPIPGMKQQGGIIDDNMGQWKYPGEITRISSPNITMKDVPYQVLGIADTGEVKLMLPNQEYYFNNASTVTEYPLISESKKKYLKKLKNG